MRTGAAAGHVGYFHEAVIYGSDDELVGIVVPYLEAALDAGEPTFAALQEGEEALVRSALGNPEHVGFLPAFSHDRPPAAIKQLAALFRRLNTDGSDQVRVVSTVPHPGLRSPWDCWCRYEAASNDLLADLPGWGLCLYDRRITPPYVLEDVERTHPRLVGADGSHLLNPRYEEPEAFVRSMPPPPPDPLQAEPPVVEMTDPSSAAARHAVERAGARTGLAKDKIDELLVAVSEVVTNAIMHGRPPVEVKSWVASGRIVVTVSDCGPGPEDPYVGLTARPSAGDDGGFGLWITHQLVAATHQRGEDRFTIRLTAGDLFV
jgi:anti-sigma regulatory factor (Ser/Thr protein kinase)